MSQIAPTCIIEKLAKLGPKHLVVEGIMKEYIKKPTLVYFTFWDSRSHPDSKGARYIYGRVPDTGSYCVVENHETAFAPLLADKSTSRMYKSTRKWVPGRHTPGFPEDLSPSQCETMGGVMKPTDYHFLENFHLTTYCDYKELINSGIFGDDSDTLIDNRRDEEFVWWPNLVVRLREVWELTKDCDGFDDPNATIVYPIHSYIRLFGVLATDKIQLQDYLILVDRRGENKRVQDFFECEGCRKLKNYYMYLRSTSLLADTTATHCDKKHDVMGKLPTDLTAATLDDFDEEQYRWANRIAECIKAWNDQPSIRPLNAFFVRWKTEEELQAEDERLNQQLMGKGPATASCDRTDELHGSPTHLFLPDDCPAGSTNGLGPRDATI